jgi:hypothetical protein
VPEPIVLTDKDFADHERAYAGMMALSSFWHIPTCWTRKLPCLTITAGKRIDWN